MFTLEDRCFIANEIKNKFKCIYNLDFSRDNIRKICYIANEHLSEQMDEKSSENDHGELINNLISDLEAGVNKFWEYRFNSEKLGRVNSVSLAFDVYQVNKIKYIEFLLLEALFEIKNIINNPTRFVKTNMHELIGLVIYQLLNNAYNDSCSIINFLSKETLKKYFVVILGINHKELNLFSYFMESKEWDKLIEDNPNAVVIDLLHPDGYYPFSKIKDELKENTLLLDTSMSNFNIHFQNIYSLKNEIIQQHQNIDVLLNDIKACFSKVSYQPTMQNRFFKENSQYKGCEPPPGSFISSEDGRTIVPKNI